VNVIFIEISTTNAKIKTSDQKIQ